MEQRNSASSGQPSTLSAAITPPAWMQRGTQYAPDRRASMLEHMARARSAPQAQAAQPQASIAKGLLVTTGWDLLREAYGSVVVSGLLALVFQSRVPLYIGAFLFLTNGERIERALAIIGIRFEPGTIGPDIIKGFVSLFGWFALLESLRASVPGWLTAWMPPAEPSWSFIAAIAFAFVVIEALATRAIRRALPWFGLEISFDGLSWATIKLVMITGAFALLALLVSF